MVNSVNGDFRTIESKNKRYKEENHCSKQKLPWNCVIAARAACHIQFFSLHRDRDKYRAWFLSSVPTCKDYFSLSKTWVNYEEELLRKVEVQENPLKLKDKYLNGDHSFMQCNMLFYF